MRKAISVCVCMVAVLVLAVTWAQVELPKALKDLVPLYPKATVVTAMDTADGSHAVLEVKGPAKDIVSFYRKAMEGKGWKTEMEMHQKENSVVALSKGKQALTVMADSSNKDKTTVALTLGKR